MNGITKVAADAYKMALDAHKAGKAKLLGLQLQLFSLGNEMRKKTNELIAKDEFTVLKNKEQRDAFIDRNMLIENDKEAALKTEVMQATAELDDLAKDLTYFKDVFRATYLPTDKE
jgi:hypothetical protein